MVQYALLKEKGDQRIIRIYNKFEEEAARNQAFYLNQETDWICRVVPIIKRGNQDAQEKEFEGDLAELFRKAIIKPRNGKLDKTMEQLSEIFGN